MLAPSTTSLVKSITEKQQALREKGVSHTTADVGQWTLWVQNFPASHGYSPTCSIDAKIKADGALCNLTMNLPLEVVFKLGELIAQLRDELQAES